MGAYAQESLFGKDKDEAGESALMGILYDLKQTQDRKPTNVDSSNYSSVLNEFFKNGWDEAILNRYYRVTKPLYTTQIYIPHISADEAPKAFGAEKTVKPGRWVIHYRGQIAPPKDGTYRFWAYGDDLVVIAVNGKMYVCGNRPDTHLPDVQWKSPESMRIPSGDGQPLVAGEWLDLKQKDPIDFDVIVGERPGGVFCAFVMVEEKGATYETNLGGPVLPILQFAPYDTPVPPSGREPKFAKGATPWKCLQ